ncbi:uncharacterized protein [Nerophis lumbriciformis]|uniref:uncharacterized protein n=1 Tax=Nerophis lumbriciformis TaxID=546530 RepID=UPI003BAD424D
MTESPPYGQIPDVQKQYQQESWEGGRGTWRWVARPRVPVSSGAELGGGGEWNAAAAGEAGAQGMATFVADWEVGTLGVAGDQVAAISVADEEAGASSSWQAWLGVVSQAAKLGVARQAAKLGVGLGIGLGLGVGLGLGMAGLGLGMAGLGLGMAGLGLGMAGLGLGLGMAGLGLGMAGLGLGLGMAGLGVVKLRLAALGVVELRLAALGVVELRLAALGVVELRLAALGVVELRLAALGVVELRLAALGVVELRLAALGVEEPETSVSVVSKVQPGPPVKLQCSVLSHSGNEICQDGHKVSWFRTGPESVHPSFVYTHDECKKIKDKSTQKCVHTFSKNVNSSDAGTYLCAVVTCGRIFMGNPIKVNNTQAGPQTLDETFSRPQQRDEDSLVYSMPTIVSRKTGKARQTNTKAAEEFNTFPGDDGME